MKYFFPGTCLIALVLFSSGSIGQRVQGPLPRIPGIRNTIGQNLTSLLWESVLLLFCVVVTLHCSLVSLCSENNRAGPTQDLNDRWMSYFMKRTRKPFRSRFLGNGSWLAFVGHKRSRRPCGFPEVSISSPLNSSAMGTTGPRKWVISLSPVNMN